MEKLGSTCSYGNNDSKFKIWRYTFHHFRRYCTWKKVAISVHCMLEINHRIFHWFFHPKNGTKRQQSISRGRRSCRGVRVFCFHCPFLQSKEAASMYQNMNHSCHKLQTDGTNGSPGLQCQCAMAAPGNRIHSFLWLRTLITNKGGYRRPEKSRKWEAFFSVHVLLCVHLMLSIRLPVCF